MSAREMMVAGQPPLTYAYDDGDRLTGITQSTANVGYTCDPGLWE